MGKGGLFLHVDLEAEKEIESVQIQWSHEREGPTQQQRKLQTKQIII